ncbi:MAG TPA: hypothetical protein VMM93_10065 [Vicinamibacterales bacterium]|nr:hypothetical protein [Vicinamibacterales bacterium]
MNHHLSPREIVEAVEASLRVRRRRHLDDCRQCHAEVESVEALIARLAAASDAPEPPPGFGAELQRRVRRATMVTPAGHTSFWWAWRAVAFAAPAAVALAVLLAPDGRLPAVPPIIGAPAAEWTMRAPVDVPVDGAIAPVAVAPVWSEVAEMAAAAAIDDLQVVTPARAGSADTLLDELTEAERVELLRLLRVEMGGGT